MIKLFSKYVSVGVINTIIHWCVFYVALVVGASQSLANLVAFLIAVTASFCINSRYTFTSQATAGRYILYVAFMGTLATLVGAMSDKVRINPITTLIIFSLLSLTMGFIYSRFVVFRIWK